MGGEWVVYESHGNHLTGDKVWRIPRNLGSLNFINFKRNHTTLVEGNSLSTK